MGVTGQVLDVLQRHVLAQQIPDHQDAERVGRENLRQPGGPQSPLEHQLLGERRPGAVGARTAAALPGVKERRPLRRLREACTFDLGHRLNGDEELPSLLDTRLGRSSLPERMTPSPNQMKRTEQDRVSGYQDVKEVPKRCQRLVFGCRPVGEFVEKPADQAGRDLSQLERLPLPSGEEPPHLVSVGRTGVGILDPGEELVRGRSRPPCRPARGRPERPRGDPFQSANRGFSAGVSGHP